MTAKTQTAVRAIKGFDRNLQCRGFQFVAGETYTHDGSIVACQSGFHAITDHPLAVFEYYPPAGSRFFSVDLSGAMHSDDKIKTAAQILTVGKELGITDLVNEAVNFVLSRSHPEGETATGTRGAASATGEQGAASATGTRGAASATGEQGAASATGTRGAASATGEQGAASATGWQGAASATGEQGVASATGWQGKVMGTRGNALFAVERADTDYVTILSCACGIVGQDGIEPEVWYRCVGGKLVAS